MQTLTAHTPTAIPTTARDAEVGPLGARIDMVDVDAVLSFLSISEQSLLDLINQGTLAAYDLGEGLRFRALDVIDLAV